MTHRKGAVWTERWLLVMILGTLAGTFNLVLTVHRHAAKATPGPLTQPSKPTPVLRPPVSQAAQIPETAAIHPSPSKPPKSAPTPTSAPLSRSAVPAEDPTVKILAGMTTALGKELAAAREADRRTEQWETARQAALGESQRWKRRELLVRQQIGALTRRAEGLEQDVSSLQVERDVLARERDLLKAALTKASQRSSYAVLPYKGPNGTWRRPIVLECTGNVAKLQPKGLTFSMLDLSPLIHPRSSPVVLAIAREMLIIERSETPDGAPAVPYLVFLVRPNGIRPYYEARARLEPLGITFGYELIEQDLVVDVPDLEDLTTWDGTVPLEPPALAAAAGRHEPVQADPAGPGPGGSVPGPGLGSSDRPTGVGAGLTFNGATQPSGAAGARSDETSTSPDDFVWPSQARRDGAGRGSGSARPQWGTGESLGLGNEPGTGSAGTQPAPSPSAGFAGGVGSPGLGPGGGVGSPGLGPGGGGWASRSGETGSGLGFPAGAANPATGQGASGPVGLGPGVSGLPPAGRGGSQFGSGGDGGCSAAMTPAGGSAGAPGAIPGSERSGTSGGAPGMLPDLEPAGDKVAMPPLPVGGGSMAGAAGPQGGTGRLQGLGADQAGSGFSAPGGSTPVAADAPDQSGGDRSALAGTMSPGGSTADSSPANGTASSWSSPFPAAGSSSASSSATAGGSSSASSAAGSRSSALAGLTSSLASDAADTSNDSSWGSPAGNSGAAGNATPASGMSLPSLGLTPNTDSDSSFLKDFTVPPLAPPDRPTGAIEVPFPIVVVCRRNDVLLHPGGYRLTTEALRRGSGTGSSQESLLKRELVALVRRRAQVDPMIRPKPSVKFLVETGGSSTFWTARGQLLFSGLDWPMSLQVAGPQYEPVLTGTTK